MPVEELTAYLRQKLPSYMVPAVWEKLDALPLTANGKVNRKALPQARNVGRPPLRSSSATQTAVAEIWSTALGREGVGLQDNFFELGGTSLAAVVILTQIRERLQIELPAAVLFEHPTVQSMADEIEIRMLETGSAYRRAASCLVPIQPSGSKAPVFCVPPIGGTVYSYLALAGHLGPDQPVYGLQGTGLDAYSEQLGSIEELAGRYVEAIRDVQPAGPYLLAGWSLGGQIAFEMAQQITRRGEKVALVALFDSFLAPGRLELDAGHWLDGARGAGILQQGSGADIHKDVRLHLQAWARHRPSAYSGDVLLFSASETDIFSRYRDVDGWRGLASNGLEVKTVQANHFTLMQEPHIGPIAQHLAAAFDRALNHVPAGAREASHDQRLVVTATRGDR